MYILHLCGEEKDNCESDTRLSGKKTLHIQQLRLRWPFFLSVCVKRFFLNV